MRGRAWARHQRERVIRLRMPLVWWVKHPGQLHWHGVAFSCRCDWCMERRIHVRHKWRREAQREIQQDLLAAC